MKNRSTFVWNFDKWFEAKLTRTLDQPGLPGCSWHSSIQVRGSSNPTPSLRSRFPALLFNPCLPSAPYFRLLVLPGTRRLSLSLAASTCHFLHYFLQFFFIFIIFYKSTFASYKIKNKKKIRFLSLNGFRIINAVL